MFATLLIKASTLALGAQPQRPRAAARPNSFARELFIPCNMPEGTATIPCLCYSADELLCPGRYAVQPIKALCCKRQQKSSTWSRNHALRPFVGLVYDLVSLDQVPDLCARVIDPAKSNKVFKRGRRW